MCVSWNNTNLKLKGKRGFLSDESSLNKLSRQRTLKMGKKIGCTNTVKMNLWHTNIAIQPYQSYRTRCPSAQQVEPHGDSHPT